MAIQPTFTTSNGKTTITFAWKADTAIVLEKANKIAGVLWDRGLGDHGTPEAPIVFGDLTNQEKLDIIFEYNTDILYGLAASKVSASADEDKQVAVEAEIAVIFE